MAIKDLRGRNCFITGAASGIGRATAIQAAREGAVLFLTDIQEEALESAVAEIRDFGGSVAYSRIADVSDFDAVKAMADEIHEAHGSMDVVLNVAGISTWGTIENLSNDDWHKVVDIDLMGPIHVMETFVPPMIEAGRGGHVVNVSSAAGLLAFPWHAAYSAAKFGLRGASEVLRYDLRRHGIGVSVCCPGAVATPLVGTVNIVGVDRENSRLVKATKAFEHRATSPESVAASIIAGIKKNRFLIFTSNDIRFGYWVKRKFALPYELAMRLANDRFTALARPR